MEIYEEMKMQKAQFDIENSITSKPCRVTEKQIKKKRTTCNEAENEPQKRKTRN